MPDSTQVQLELSPEGDGVFYIEIDGEAIAEMLFKLRGTTMTVYHTEVLPEDEGKGNAKMLLDEMVRYAREHTYKVHATCPYVLSVFKRQPEQYKDIWTERK